MSSRAKKTPKNSRANTPAGTKKERSGYALSRIDGSALFYVDKPAQAASPNTPAIILSDGLGCDGFAWKYIQKDLAKDYRLVHWHYPGHGRSPRRDDESRLSMSDLATDLLAVMDDAQIEAAVLFGHSMGVQVSLEVYRQAKERVRALGFLCGMAENPLKTFRGTDTLEVALPALQYLVSRAPRVLSKLARTVVPTRLAFAIAEKLEVNTDLIDAADFMPYLRGLSRVDPDLFVSMLAEAGRHSARDLLPSIAVPTLIIAGDQDGFTPPALSEELAKSIPGAELVMIEGGTHTAPIERPDIVKAAVDKFLRTRL
jgi:pimeloyl-ACP methyl ester carboxylesterase